MIQIKNKAHCCGCTACATACPRGCITMEKDAEGFLYPRVDTTRCTDCGLCQKVCPMDKGMSPEAMPLDSYVGRDKRAGVLGRGTSGGIYTAIMEYVLGLGGVVYGAVTGEDRVVRHVRVESPTDGNFVKIPGSKYVRSDIVGIYALVKEDLAAGRTVVFSGTPCQVAGLKTFLGKDDSQLLTVDIVCHGTPSPLLWERYVEWQEQKYGSRIRSVRFRNKTYGYHSGTMKLEFENGRTYYASARVDLFLRSFFSDLCSRPSCYDCRFKQAKHVSDLTLFDAWHAAELNVAVRDDDRGYTNIFVQSERGRALLEAVRRTMELYETDAGQAIALDGVMVRDSVRWNDKREVFFLGLTDEPLDRHCKKFFKITCKDCCIEKAKRFIYRKKRRLFGGIGKE